MTRRHTVERGECLSSIAAHYGLRSWRSIYDHPENEDFRATRPDPNVIFPGDEVVIPGIEAKTVSIMTNASHEFRLQRTVIVLRLDLKLDETELESSDYELEIDGTILDGKLEEGRLDHPIPAASQHAELRLLHPSGQMPTQVYQLHIGHLDPVDTVTGVQARLRRLGFDCGKVDGVVGPRTRAALWTFKVASGVVDDEEPYGSATERALLDALGH